MDDLNGVGRRPSLQRWGADRRLLDAVPVIGAAAGATRALEEGRGEVEIDPLRG